MIVDASGIGSIDITAADRLVILNRNLRAKGIRFYLTEHVGAVNDQLRAFGAGSLVEEGVARRTISLALRDAGVDKPYPLENENGLNMKYAFVEAQERLAEFEWAFGNDAEEKMEQIAIEIARQITAANEHSAETLKKQKITYHGAVSVCMTKKSCLTVWKCICLKWHRTTLKMKVRLKSRLNSEEVLLN